MSSEKDLREARSIAEAILTLNEEALTRLFFEETMRRNLARTVRHLDLLVSAGGDDRSLGEGALKKLGFASEE